MASEKHKKAKGKRDIAKGKRDTAVSKMKSIKDKKSPEWKAARDDVIKASAKVRKQGDIMRAETGREKGQKTKFTGPQKASTIQAIKDLQAADSKMYVGSSLQETDWTKANVSLMNKIKADNYADRRRQWDQMWADDRAGMVKKQQNELTRLKNANLLDTIKLDEKLVEDSNRVSRTPAKMTGGSEYLATDYDRPAFQDWSDLEPPNMPGLLGSAKAQQDLLGSGMAAYQPWAQPAIEYQPPVGPTYATRASLLGSSPAEAAAAAAAAKSAAAAAASSSSSSGDGYTGPLGQSWDNYHDWYMNSPYTSPSAANHQAALRRLYLDANPQASGILDSMAGGTVSDPRWATHQVPITASSAIMGDFGPTNAFISSGGETAPTFSSWFYDQGGEGASAGPIFGGVLGNKS